MEISCKIKAKHNFKNIDTIIKKLPQKIEESIEDILKNIQGYAIRLERGHNSEGILVEMVDVQTNKVKGRVYTDKNTMPYAMYEHWGTGQFAEMKHVGKTEHFIQSGYTKWYIPINKVDRSLNYPIKVINGQKFYIAHGAKPNHFMTDAEFKTRNENPNIVVKKLKEMFREVCK